MQLPQIPDNGQQLYDELMAKIEPELTTAQIHLLPERYRSENLSQAKVRAARYTKAYEEYDEAYDAYMSSVKEQVNRCRTDAFRSLEKEDRTRDQEKLAVFESLLFPNAA